MSSPVEALSDRSGLPVAVGEAIPVAGIEEQDEIPIVTSVVLIDDDDEPRREDTDRFWNIVESSSGGPKHGIGCFKGWWEEISPVYTMSYVFLVVCLTISLVGTSGVFGPSCAEYLVEDTCWRRSRIFIFQVFTACLYGLFVLTRLVSCGVCGDPTAGYLLNRIQFSEVAERLENYRGGTPEITLRVHCWHKENQSSGNGKSKIVNVTTYRYEERLSLRSCVDVTEGLDDLNLAEYRLTKVKLTKLLMPDEAFLQRKRQLYERNRRKDKRCDVTWNMVLKDFKPYMLAFVPDTAQSERKLELCLLDMSVYVLAHLFVYPALPYRIWLASVTGKVKIDIRKKIETESFTTTLEWGRGARSLTYPT